MSGTVKRRHNRPTREKVYRTHSYYREKRLGKRNSVPNETRIEKSTIEDACTYIVLCHTHQAVQLDNLTQFSIFFSSE
jgi:hypothetical protein